LEGILQQDTTGSSAHLAARASATVWVRDGREDDVDEGYGTPGEAALADWDWDPTATAKVLAVKVDRDTAVVLIEIEPYHRMQVSCEQRDGRWFLRGHQELPPETG